MMIAAIVYFDVSPKSTVEEATAIFTSTAPRYRGLPGLIRKYYIADGAGTAGGVYLWETRAQAEAFYDAAWYETVEEQYGAPPEVRYFESPVIVDNTTDEITTTAGGVGLTGGISGNA